MPPAPDAPSGSLPLPPAGPGGRGVRWGLGDVFIGIVLFFAVQMVVAVAAVAVLTVAGREVGPSGGDGLLLLVITAPAGWVVMVGWPLWLSRVKGTGSPARDFGLAVQPLDVLIGLGGGAMALAVSVLMALTYTAVSGDPAPSNTDLLAGDLNQVFVVVVLFLIVAIGTPIAEEILFRGLVLGAARKRWGTVGGVAFSSLIFGAFHVQADPLAWLFVGTVTACYGVVFALMRVWTQGRLGASVIAHMVVNAVAILAVVAAA